jgi:hypothetical protein
VGRRFSGGAQILEGKIIVNFSAIDTNGVCSY